MGEGLNGQDQQEPTQPQGSVNGQSAPNYRKTPMYMAINAPRYQRQQLIRELEKQTGRTLLCYICGEKGEINRNDALGIVELLHNVQPGASIDLMLHTFGGDVDAAEKLINMLRAAVVPTASLRVIVTDAAKSAGTLMALGADEIVMSDTSELGTIDPQLELKDGKGNTIVHSVLSYLDAFDAIATELRNAPDDPVFKIQLESFDPTVLRTFDAVRTRAKTLAENLLKRVGLNYTAIAAALMDTKRFPSHSQMIGYETAKEIGLNVTYMPSEDATWQRYWELYCHLRLAVIGKEKLFESARASLPLDI
ncbi:hypothetical protein ACFPT7_05715 [Acidicapsa dinghuensis]|uniref:Serine dehydrogenase proteinase n=1 Tax=Acidicapsa dinghuensis TaxID=2218256 RepID=A0ABW1ED32_9BACT|nr:hypothetical protein [Acidicapsa dinghuensis]